MRARHRVRQDQVVIRYGVSRQPVRSTAQLLHPRPPLNVIPQSDPWISRRWPCVAPVIHCPSPLRQKIKVPTHTLNKQAFDQDYRFERY
jgi:hypothetical protein